MKDFAKTICYHEPKAAIKIGAVTYWAADRHGAREFNGDAIINLTGVPCIPQLYHIPELNKFVSKQKEIVIAWPDFDLPRIENGFWEALHKYCVGNKLNNVCIHCAGGHGRTGTALAAIIISNIGWNVIKTIEHVRKTVCRKMVETPKQCEYLWLLDKEMNNSTVEENDVPLSAEFIERQLERNMTKEELAGALNWVLSASNGDKQNEG